MKKRRWLLLVVLSLCMISCHNERPVVLLGCFSKTMINELQEESNKPILTAFTSNTMISNELYKIADTKSIAVVNQKKYSFDKQIRKTKDIVISMGISDFLPYLTIDAEHNCFEYDVEQCEKQKELLVYNIHHTLEEIRSINAKANIYVLGAYAFYDFEEPEQKLLTSFLLEISYCLELASKDHNTKFVSVHTLQNEKEICSTLVESIQ